MTKAKGQGVIGSANAEEKAVVWLQTLLGGEEVYDICGCQLATKYE